MRRSVSALCRSDFGEAEELIEKALQLFAAGKRADAVTTASLALASGEARLGPSHPELVPPLTVLARLYQSQGKYTDAEPLWSQALTIKDNALSPYHKEVLALQDNLGML